MIFNLNVYGICLWLVFIDKWMKVMFLLRSFIQKNEICRVIMLDTEPLLGENDKRYFEPFLQFEVFSCCSLYTIQLLYFIQEDLKLMEDSKICGRWFEVWQFFLNLLEIVSLSHKKEFTKQRNMLFDMTNSYDWHYNFSTNNLRVFLFFLSSLKVI